MLPNTGKSFPDYFTLQNQTPGFYFPYENSYFPAFILHSKFILHKTKHSLRDKIDTFQMSMTKLTFNVNVRDQIYSLPNTFYNFFF